MIQFIKRLLGSSDSPVNYKTLMEQGAMVLDVRTTGEYASGHIQGSMNIPLQQLGEITKRIKNKEQIIITCCASGMRSASARTVLRQQGYTNVYNGGGWASLQSKIR